MAYTQQGQIAHLLQQISDHSGSLSKDFSKCTDRALIDWLFEELLELRQVEESHSANATFNSLCELDDCLILMKELSARRVTHPCDTSRPIALANVLIHNAFLANAFTSIHRRRAELRAKANCGRARQPSH